MKVFIHHINLHFETVFCQYLLGINNETENEDSKFEMIGTVTDESIDFQAPNVHIIHNFNHRLYRQSLDECDVIVFRLTDLSDVDHAIYTLKILEQFYINNNSDKARTFILVSNVVTWAKTSKFYTSDDEYEPYHEEAAITRKAHDKYNKFLDVEKQVRRMHSEEHLRTFVVCSGIIYGEGEDIFHQFFKMAWVGKGQLPCFMQGSNYIPTIHVRDLAGIVYFLIDHFSREPSIHRYCVAVDESTVTLKEIVEAIAQVYEMENTTARNLSFEQAILYDYIDFLLLDMKFDIKILKEAWDIGEWWCKEGMVHSMHQIRKEFEVKRNLTPLRISIDGPPISGKSYFSQAISKAYKLPLITIDEVANEYFKRELEAISELEPVMTRRLERERRKKEKEDYDKQKKKNKNAIPPPHYNDPEPEFNEEEEEEVVKRCNEVINEFAALRKQVDEKGNFNDLALSYLLNWKLNQRECRVKGWVLEDYPKSIQQAMSLMIVGQKPAVIPPIVQEQPLDRTKLKSSKSIRSVATTKSTTPSNMEIQEEPEEEKPVNPEDLKAKKDFFTNFIIVLEPTYEVLIDRLKLVNSSDEMKEKFDEGYNEYLERKEQDVVEFLKQIKSEDPMYEEEFENPYPNVLRLAINSEDDEATVYQNIVDFVGPPHNYGPTQEEINAMKNDQAERNRVEEELLELERKEREEIEQREREEIEAVKQVEEDRIQKILQEEKEELEVRSKPLQHYLLDNVIPVLTRGIIQVINEVPEDPVEFLAHFLLHAAESTTQHTPPQLEQQTSEHA